MSVWLIKPSTDSRDGENLIQSRMGLRSEVRVIAKTDDVFKVFDCEAKESNVIIADECQFFTRDQIDQLRKIADERDVPVLCFGLRTDFLTRLFPGSHRLFLRCVPALVPAGLQVAGAGAGLRRADAERADHGNPAPALPLRQAAPFPDQLPVCPGRAGAV